MRGCFPLTHNAAHKGTIMGHDPAAATSTQMNYWENNYTTPP